MRGADLEQGAAIPALLKILLLPAVQSTEWCVARGNAFEWFIVVAFVSNLLLQFALLGVLV